MSPEQADELTSSRNANPTAILLDESGDMSRDYDAPVSPDMYIIDGDGILRLWVASTPTPAPIRTIFRELRSMWWRH